MKYALLCLILLAACAAAGWGLACRITKIPGFRSAKKLAAAAFCAVLLLGVCCAVFLESYYRAGDATAACLADGASVHVRQIDGAYFFDGPGEARAIVFFPGARVEESAYAPLLFDIAERGTDCFLLKMPFRMAVFGADAPDGLIRAYDYESWYMMGHSLGGVMAERYAAAHSETTDGVILLAAYADRELPDSERLLSIYGSCDGILDRESYEINKRYWPEQSCELAIEGGNHAGFGDYGPQRGDGAASISAAEQKRQTVDAILRFLTP